jgi:hypothetical protein
MTLDVAAVEVADDVAAVLDVEVDVELEAPASTGSSAPPEEPVR